MHIAFYAPLKSPAHPVASGDRTIARLLMRAIEHAGHSVEVACALRTFDAAGDPSRQARMRAIGQRAGERLAGRLRSSGRVPACWITYHLYHKAPDWTGPVVTRRLGLPYVVVEASYAAKQADGPWRSGLAGVAEALAQARAVVALKSVDVGGVRPRLRAEAELVRLAPFLDTGSIAGPESRAAARIELAGRHGLDPAVPWVAALAMLRPGDKASSYALLANALARLGDRPWQLVAIGEGPARTEIAAGLGALGADRVRMTGAWAPEDVARLLCGFDVFAWPAIGEAIGMALLEASAAGLPVVAGRSGGVDEVIQDAVTGVLTPAGDEAAFARALARMLDDGDHRRRLGRAGRASVLARHSVEAASAALDALLTRIAPER